MARLAGFEPAANGSEVRCSIQLSYERINRATQNNGVSDGDRTHDPQNHNLML